MHLKKTFSLFDVALRSGLVFQTNNGGFSCNNVFSKAVGNGEMQRQLPCLTPGA